MEFRIVFYLHHSLLSNILILNKQWEEGFAEDPAQAIWGNEK